MAPKKRNSAPHSTTPHRASSSRKALGQALTLAPLTAQQEMAALKVMTLG